MLHYTHLCIHTYYTHTLHTHTHYTHTHTHSHTHNTLHKHTLHYTHVNTHVLSVIDLLIYYMVSSSCIGLCPLLGSLVHWVPYPTSIVVYCATLSILIFVLEMFLESKMCICAVGMASYFSVGEVDSVVYTRTDVTIWISILSLIVSHKLLLILFCVLY